MTDKAERNAAIAESHFQGESMCALARRHRLSYSRVYQIVQRERRKRRVALPVEAPPATTDRTAI